MPKEANPSLEVATIKPHNPAFDTQGFNAVGDRISIRNESLISMLMFAYSVHPKQIVGLPSWAHDHWDIEGKTDTSGEPNLRQQQEMLRELLADRFHLKLRHSQRELPVYAMRIAKDGPKLKSAVVPDAETGQYAGGDANEMKVDYTSTDMHDFTLGESFFLDRPLVDQTGLKGKYDFTLHYTYKLSAANDTPNAPPDLFTAVKEELGLVFIPLQAAVDVIVIDQVELPSAN